MKKLLISLLLVLFIVGCDEVILPPVEEPIEEPVIEEPKPIDENYYRLFDRDVEKTFTIEISQTEFNKLDQYMVNYRNQYGNYKTDQVVSGKLTYEDDLGTIIMDNIAFRGRGNTSRVRLINDDQTWNPSHYKVYFDKPLYLDETSEAYKTIDKRRVFGVSELNFKYNRNGDSSYVSERYSYELFESYDVLAPKITHAKVFLKIGSKKMDMGIYNIIESIDKDFLQKRLNENDGDLYKSLWQQYGPATLEANYPSGAIGIKHELNNYFPAYDLKTNKTNNDHQNLKTLITMLNDLDGTYFEQYLEANFEVDALIRYLAVGVLLGNPDDYRAMGNNYYLYQNSDTLKWQIIPYDYDHSLGQGWDGAPIFSNYTVGSDIYTWGNLNRHMLNREVSHPLVDKLLKIEKYQLQYEAYLKDLIDNHFTFESYQLLFETTMDLYMLDATSGLIKIPFGLRGQSYFESKRQDVLSQLEYYQNNPSKRP
ncbi:MAG: hypothetical protein CVV63_02540 [Tenericutes bacterium HGW-Tenericutes-8]|nr:MAG: hypothetical protein CVV63_02540 [Tenericutes bacterium HGW-Tenericutes-8]